MASLSADRRLLGTFAVALLLLVAITGLSFNDIGLLISNNRALTHTQEVLAAVQTTLSIMQDAETGQRGYLITGLDDYLAPYESVQSRITAQVDLLRRLTADNPTQQAHLPALQTHITAKLDELAATIRLRRTGDFAAAKAVVQTGRGKTEMDAIRAALAEMQGEEQRLLAIRNQATDNSTTSSLILAGGLALSDFALLGALYATLRRAARTRRQAEAARLRATLASIGDGVIVTDLAGIVTFMNAVAEQLTGYALAQAIGRTLDEVFHIVNESTRAPVENPARRVLQAGVTVGLANHTCLLGADSVERPIDDSAAPIRDEAGRLIGVVLVFRDVSERRREEGERTRLLEATQQAVGLRDQFLSVASHELKTPLTSLLASAQLVQRRMMRDGTLTERDQRSLNLVVQQAQRLNRMIASLLDLSRLQSGQLSIERTPLDFAALTARIVEELQPTFSNHSLQLDVPATPLWIDGDALRLEQVLQNLIGNAVKYSPKGGSVIVRVSAADQVCLTVTDSGIGIPAAALPHLFDRFYRAPNAATAQISGIGLGLFVVQQIITLHGGTITVTSTEGQGSTFTVYLPPAAP